MAKPIVRSVITRTVLSMGISYVTRAVCGSMYHFLKGMYTSPSGQRVAGGTQAVRNTRSYTHQQAVRWSKRAGIRSTCIQIMETNPRLDRGYKWNRFVAGVTAGVITDGRDSLWRWVLACGLLYGGMEVTERVFFSIKDRDCNDKIRLQALMEDYQMRQQAMLQHDHIFT